MSTYSTLSSKACHLIFDGVALWETCLPSKFEWIEWRQVFESYYVTFLLESAASEPWNFHNQWTSLGNFYQAGGKQWYKAYLGGLHLLKG